MAIQAAVVALATSSATAQHAPASADLAFTEVHVVDIELGRVLPRQTVLIAGDRIAAVGPAGTVPVPAGTRVVDARDGYLIPGLWDMHAHTVDDRITRETYLPLYLANGVTGVRNMHADCFAPCGNDRTTLAEVRRWQREIASGELVGPRMVAASDVIQAPPPGEPSSVDRPTTADEAHALVHRLKERGVDLLKTYSMLPREAYFALADEARTVGIPFAGHVPLAVRASEAADSGQRSFEHFEGFYEECSAREDELRPRLFEPGFVDIWPLLIESFSREKCSALFARLVRNGTWVVPTLMVTETYSRIGDDLWLEDARLRYVAPEEREYWAGRIRHDAALSPNGFEPARQMNRWQRRIVTTMRDAGVRILAGSDAGMPFVIPGFGLHDELELLVDAGFTPAEALRAATLSAAEYLEGTDSLGSVAPGKLADMVLLDANPLEDIRNTQRIRGVVFDGRYFDRPALDKVLAAVEKAVLESVIHVAPPTGEKEADRASIIAALDQVRPGGTIRFAPGTYLVGEFIDVSVPRVTLEGHAEGTTLRGCEPAAFAEMDRAIAECNGLNLTGGNQTVRDLTFEHTWHALSLGGLRCTPRQCGPDDTPMRERAGGYHVEGNTFRESQNGIRVIGQWNEPAVIRGNRFVDTYHAVMINGMTAHVLDNDIAVPEPGRVPYTHHPGLALLIGGWDEWEVPACDGNVIAGNRISGHPDAIAILQFPGGTCRRNEIRDNIIEMAPVRFASASTALHVRTDADSTIAGVAIAFLNGPFGDGVIEENAVEHNRISGAAGVAIELVGASRNRIAGNTISGVTRRQPFPGNTLFPFVPAWTDANGSGIWLSPGSDENEIIGNAFENVATHAVAIEGDGNRVELRSASDGVHDSGSGNRIEAATYQSEFVETRGIRLHYLDFGGTGLPLIFVHDWYEDAHTWTTMAPPFADAHRVLAMTRRGYGQSDDVGWGYDVATQAEDILGFMDALGIEQAVLVGRHPTTQDMTWIAEHHPQRLAGLVYLYHSVWPSPGDARILRDRTFAEMFNRFGGCWMGEEAYERGAPRLVYRPHYIDDENRRIDVPALSFTHPQDLAAGMGEADLLDLTLALATSADPGGGICDRAAIEPSVAWLTELAGDAERLAEARTLIPTSAERRGYAEAFERAFGSNLRVVRLDVPADYRTDPEAYQSPMRTFLADLIAARGHTRDADGSAFYMEGNRNRRQERAP